MKHSFLFLLTIAIGVRCAGQVIIKANDPHLHYMGRVAVQDSASVLSWSGSAVDINFYGTDISAVLKDEMGYNTYNVIIDGKVLNIIHPDATKKSYTLVSGLPPGKHSLELFKRTEWAMGKTWFYGLQIANNGKILPPPPTKKRKIEFYGNSITCGYAVLDTTGQDRGTAPYEDGYISYAAITARYFNAEFYSISKSGIGVTVSWFPMIMPEMYDRLDANDPDSKWDFSKYTPDVVVINLFQNDSWIVQQPTNPQFKARFGTAAPSADFIISAYSNFVKNIRNKYPKAHIICILGSMDATRPGSPWPGYIQKAVALLNDKNIYTHFIPYKNTNGHPSAKEQQAMANDLEGFIAKNIKW